MAELHFVFLQGMPSPFFSRIANALSTRGAKATGINFCVGDWIFWRGPGTVNYRGTAADWPAFFQAFCARENVTDLVLLGEQREYHKQAVAVAQACGVRVSVTDFGYLRPDWITLEQDGMGGNSRFPRNPAEIRLLAAKAPPADLSRYYADSTGNMAVGDLLYSFSNVFLWWLFPHYRRSDKRPHPLIYFPAIGKRLLMTRLRRQQVQRQVQAILETRERYFVFPLQLEHDFQIVAYSPFDRLDDAIHLVLQSFALHSDAGTRLVIKVHPWEPGLKNWKRIISQFARTFGIAERVDYLEGGSLDDLIKNAAGMVTVNSTSGVRAIQLGCPVTVLGKAIYDISGLTYQGDLDRFWVDAHRPDSELVDAFVNAIATTIQIRGVFFDEPGISVAVNEAVERLFVGAVGQPL
jgi:capsular polysaccharide export protein